MESKIPDIVVPFMLPDLHHWSPDQLLGAFEDFLKDLGPNEVIGFPWKKIFDSLSGFSSLPISRQVGIVKRLAVYAFKRSGVDADALKPIQDLIQASVQRWTCLASMSDEDSKKVCLILRALFCSTSLLI